MAIEYPDCQEELSAAVKDFLARRTDSKEAKDARGRHATVDEHHVFLLMFMYLHGGMLQFTGPFLPGIKVSAGQVSRLLTNAMPVVAAECITDLALCRGC